MTFKKYITLSRNAKYAAIKIVPPARRGNPGKAREKRKNPTSDAVVRRNKKSLTMRLWGLIVSNYDEHDYHITLTYDDKRRPESEEAAKRTFEKYKRKLKRKAEKEGIELRMIWVTEKGTQNKYHHHIIINKEVPTDLIFDLWREDTGGVIVKAQELNKNAGNSPDFYDLASYIVKEKTAEYDRTEDFNKKAYSRTRNLFNAETEVKNTKKQLVEPPRGYDVVPGSVEWYIDPFTGLESLEYRVMAKDQHPRRTWRKGKKIPITRAYDLHTQFIEEQLSLF